ncbi:MAG: putative Ig domain-containing protein [Acidimicrobiales bacterium]
MRTSGKRWRVGVVCTLFAGASVVAPIVILTGNVSATTPAQDKIIYVQKSGQQKTGPYVEYEGANGTNLTQSLSLANGSCSGSTVSNPTSPLLPFSASYYSSGYSGTSTAASVGSTVTKQGVAETGVCVNSRTSPGYTIQPNEGLVFSIGTNSLTAGRVFSQATIPLKRNDSTRGSLSGSLVLRRANSSGIETTVDTVPFSVPVAGTESPGDTNDCPVVSTGVVPAADQFDQLEIQVDSPSTGSVSVTGPNCDNDNDADDTAVPTFYLDSAPTITTTSIPAFTVGTEASVSVNATGYPTPTVTDNSSSSCPTALPTGLSFTSGSGTGTLAGTPAAGTGGTYTLCIQASNDDTTKTEAFSFAVDQAPAISPSPTTTAPTFTVGSSGSFTASASGFPTPTVTDSYSGCGTTVPTDNLKISYGTGTVTLSGSPGSNDVGTYNLCVQANNSVGTAATADYTVTINEVPSLSTNPSTTTPVFTVGTDSSFVVNAAGSPTPTVTDSYSGCTTSVPLDNLTLATAPGTLTLSGTAGSNDVGTYNLCVQATNGVGTPVTEKYIVTINEPPAITTTTGSTTFTVGTGGNFTVDTSGSPTPKITDSYSGCTSNVPTGDLSFADNGDGTATLSGTPTVGDIGVWNLCVQASNGVGTAATAEYQITVNEAPAITTTSGSQTFTVGSSGSFTVDTTGSPTPSLSDSYTGNCTSVPSDLDFADNLNGTGTLSGSPAPSDVGTYDLCVQASNGVGAPATAQYTITVNEPPAITSYNDAILALPGSGATTFTVTTTGSPTPSLSLDASPGGKCLSSPPAGITFTDNGDGTGTWSVTSAATAGTYCFQIDASNGVGTMATQLFTLVVTSPTVPYQASVSAPSGDPVSASIALSSGVKSFVGFQATGSPGQPGSVVFQGAPGDESTFTATVDVDWGDLAYCVPYASSDPTQPACQPTEVTIGSASPTPVYPCDPSNLPTAADPGWCSQSDSYSYTDVGGTEYTVISQVLFGAGDVTFSRG